MERAGELRMFPSEMAVKPAVALRAIFVGGVAIIAKAAGAMKAAAIPGQKKDSNDTWHSVHGHEEVCVDS
ncbi:hypothetical protein SADUNF_Sadunf03G0023800 [Salix dunnii]|uniref:Uncharacterized protein n=1 Tax=Salix dunnii TaxID=1413687 RepID=A0A835KAW3_9ROSI|nr:hypothetical protein SADUNF_Sadunf03G0023800 [Salix dunnii]